MAMKTQTSSADTATSPVLIEKSIHPASNLLETKVESLQSPSNGELSEGKSEANGASATDALEEPKDARETIRKDIQVVGRELTKEDTIDECKQANGDEQVEDSLKKNEDAAAVEPRELKNEKEDKVVALSKNKEKKEEIVPGKVTSVKKETNVAEPLEVDAASNKTQKENEISMEEVKGTLSGAVREPSTKEVVTNTVKKEYDDIKIRAEVPAAEMSKPGEDEPVKGSPVKVGFKTEKEKEEVDIPAKKPRLSGDIRSSEMLEKERRCPSVSEEENSGTVETTVNDLSVSLAISSVRAAGIQDPMEGKEDTVDIVKSGAQDAEGVTMVETSEEHLPMADTGDDGMDDEEEAGLQIDEDVTSKQTTDDDTADDLPDPKSPSSSLNQLVKLVEKNVVPIVPSTSSGTSAILAGLSGNASSHPLASIRKSSPLVSALTSGVQSPPVPSSVPSNPQTTTASTTATPTTSSNSGSILDGLPKGEELTNVMNRVRFEIKMLQMKLKEKEQEWNQLLVAKKKKEAFWMRLRRKKEVDELLNSTSSAIAAVSSAISSTSKLVTTSANATSVRPAAAAASSAATPSVTPSIPTPVFSITRPDLAATVISSSKIHSEHPGALHHPQPSVSVTPAPIPKQASAPRPVVSVPGGSSSITSVSLGGGGTVSQHPQQQMSLLRGTLHKKTNQTIPSSIANALSQLPSQQGTFSLLQNAARALAHTNLTGSAGSSAGALTSGLNFSPRVAGLSPDAFYARGMQPKISVDSLIAQHRATNSSPMKRKANSPDVQIIPPVKTQATSKEFQRASYKEMIAALQSHAAATSSLPSSLSHSQNHPVIVVSSASTSQGNRRDGASSDGYMDISLETLLDKAKMQQDSAAASAALNAVVKSAQAASRQKELSASSQESVNYRHSVSPHTTSSTLSNSSGSSKAGKEEPQPAQQQQPLCRGCKKRTAQFVCAGCNKQWYCSRPCQVGQRLGPAFGILQRLKMRMSAGWLFLLNLLSPKVSSCYEILEVDTNEVGNCVNPTQLQLTLQQQLGLGKKKTSGVDEENALKSEKLVNIGEVDALPLPT
ncbi:unnamed protein product [Cyprideis torosa]|uniref:Uncharacterized protein n=1 Tax=Cyprideis torosa TaxID=163714 RepID=A0A7R8WEF3_9CRUS|nr:unnamed protein product [Cyprideis torosa]CAG0890225.1 unnamed protein product [Cyprideis torosa]